MHPKSLYYYECGKWTYLELDTITRFQRIFSIDLSDPQVQALIHTTEVQAQICKDAVAKREEKFKKHPKLRQRATQSTRKKLTGRRNRKLQQTQAEYWNNVMNDASLRERAKIETLSSLRKRLKLPTQRIERAWTKYVRKHCKQRVPTDSDANRCAAWLSHDLRIAEPVIVWYIDRKRGTLNPRGPRRGVLPDIDLVFFVREIQVEHPDWDWKQISHDANARLGRMMTVSAVKQGFHGNKKWLLPLLPKAANEFSPWTKEHNAYLHEHHKSKTHAQLAVDLDRSLKAVEIQCIRLGLARRQRQPGRPWTPEEDAFLRDYFPTTRNWELARRLDRTVGAVNARRKFLGLRKQHVRVSTAPRRAHRGRQWTPMEDARLRRYFGRLPRSRIGQMLDRSVASINARCVSLGLRGRASA
jgi:hypothetical protein